MRGKVEREREDERENWTAKKGISPSLGFRSWNYHDLGGWHTLWKGGASMAAVETEQCGAGRAAQADKAIRATQAVWSSSRSWRTDHRKAGRWHGQRRVEGTEQSEWHSTTGCISHAEWSLWVCCSHVPTWQLLLPHQPLWGKSCDCRAVQSAVCTLAFQLHCYGGFNPCCRLHNTMFKILKQLGSQNGNKQWKQEAFNTKPWVNTRGCFCFGELITHWE